MNKILDKKLVINRCIYCRSTSDELTDEHSIPSGLDGNWELKKAACIRCHQETSRIENVLSTWLDSVRFALEVRTTKKKRRLPKLRELEITNSKGRRILKLSPEEHPAPVVFPIYNKPLNSKGVNLGGVLTIFAGRTSKEDLVKKYDIKSMTTTVNYKAVDAARMFAKIAYCSSLFIYELNDYEEVFVLPAILGKRDDIGCWVESAEDEHEIAAGNFTCMVRCSLDSENVVHGYVKFFGMLAGVPEYHVIIGRINQQASAKELTV